jgi:hypothetical protein
LVAALVEAANYVCARHEGSFLESDFGKNSKLEALSLCQTIFQRMVPVRERTCKKSQQDS